VTPYKVETRTLHTVAVSLERKSMTVSPRELSARGLPPEHTFQQARCTDSP